MLTYLRNYVAYGARPLKGGAEFEVKINKICRTIMWFDFGVVLVSNKSDPAMCNKMDYHVLGVKYHSMIRIMATLT